MQSVFLCPYFQPFLQHILIFKNLILPTQTKIINNYKWMFLKIGVPPNHPFQKGFSLFSPSIHVGGKISLFLGWHPTGAPPKSHNTSRRITDCLSWHGTEVALEPSILVIQLSSFRRGKINLKPPRIHVRIQDVPNMNHGNPARSPGLKPLNF